MSDFETLKAKALEVSELYDQLNIKRNGEAWSYHEVAEGFVGDVGDLMKLVMAKSGKRKVDGDVDELLKHELADCFWSIIVLADKLGVDLPTEFQAQMTTLAEKIKSKL